MTSNKELHKYTEEILSELLSLHGIVDCEDGKDSKLMKDAFDKLVNTVKVYETERFRMVSSTEQKDIFNDIKNKTYRQF